MFGAAMSQRRPAASVVVKRRKVCSVFCHPPMQFFGNKPSEVIHGRVVIWNGCPRGKPSFKTPVVAHPDNSQLEGAVPMLPKIGHSGSCASGADAGDHAPPYTPCIKPGHALQQIGASSRHSHPPRTFPKTLLPSVTKSPNWWVSRLSTLKPVARLSFSFHWYSNTLHAL